MGLCRSMEGGGSSQGGYQPGVDLNHLISSAVFVRGIFTGKCMWCAEGMVQKPWWQMSLYDRHYVLPKYPCSWQLQVLGCSCCSGIRSAYGDFCSSGISRTCRASVTHLPLSCSSATAYPELPGAAEAPVWDASALLMYCNRACPEGLWHADFLWSWRHKTEIYTICFTSLVCCLIQLCAQMGRKAVVKKGS